MPAEQVTDPVAYHGEGPVWSPLWGGLRWVDMLAGDVLSLDPDGRIERRHVGTVAAAVRPRRSGGAVLGVERGFALEDPSGAITTLDPLWLHDRVRMNEGACDPDGRFYCGSMGYDRQPGAGSVYRLDPDGSVRAVVEGVTISNGLDWSPDGSLAYYNDTETYRVDVFDYDTDSGLTARRPFVTIDPDDGRPDGLTVDAEGGVWVALNLGGAVRRYGSDGALEAVVELPVRKVTACTFGGERLNELYITTSREGLAPDEEPAAGSLFRADVGVVGQPVREFAG
ncbi:MAG TPA: SMP-30/gluconolactonase/LRE family protein [Acidimicrobiia bacterium]|nr:SMP-30/gluconolactonase/LRE family protein [Acidimicrobiia bacterium]